MAAGLSPALRSLEGMAAETKQTNPPEQLLLQENGWMPNNPRLPVLIYREAVDISGDGGTRMEQLFSRNGWPPQWRNGIYTFHHFHSTAHEVLGVAAGEVRLVLGGEHGSELSARAGDVLVLPTGIGHCELTCSDDLLVIGAYPPGQHWDICRNAPDESARKRMASLPFPNSDPVHGPAGPLARFWLSTARRTRAES